MTHMTAPVDERIEMQFPGTQRVAAASGLGNGRDYNIPIFFSSDN